MTLDGVRLQAISAPYRSGKELLFELAEADEQRRGDLMNAWAQQVRDADWSNGAPLDLLPHNMLIDENDELVLIDDEYRADGWERADVLARGALTVALKLASITPARTWQQTTVGELARHLGAMVDLDSDWLDDAIMREARLRRTVRPASDVDQERILRRAVAVRLADGPLDSGQAIQRLLTAEKSLTKERAARAAAEKKTVTARRDLKRAREENTKIRSTRGYRLLTVFRRIYRRLCSVIPVRTRKST